MNKLRPDHTYPPVPVEYCTLCTCMYCTLCAVHIDMLIKLQNGFLCCAAHYIPYGAFLMFGSIHN